MFTFANFSKILVESLLKKFNQAYKQQFNTKLPMIAVFGSVGKSSQTFLLVQLFKRAGYQVLSSKKNTINGLGMLLSGQDYNFEGKLGIFRKIQFVLSLIKANFFLKPKLSPKSILILEVGFDHQNEANDFNQLFTNNLDLAIVTALTDEHNQNYSSLEFDNQVFEDLSSYLPDLTYNSLKNSNLLNDTKNVILEMLKPLEFSKNYILPTALGTLSNEIIISPNQVLSPNYIYKDNVLLVEGFKSSRQYYLPETFAKTFLVVMEVSKLFKIESNIVEDTILDFTFRWNKQYYNF
jgi:Mur ligase middle domain